MTHPLVAPPSELLAGRYQLLNQLGRGGTGTAHRALDRLTGRVVTLKRLHLASEAEPARGSGRRLALAEEFRLLASLRHPNIVSVLDYGFDEARRPFFCMDLQENARTIVDAGSGSPPAVRAELLVQLLRALAYLHRHRIIHCDIKPENVVVAAAQVRVLDFGLSVYRDLLEPSDAPLGGTLAYLAPELLRGEPPSERSDLYAVGVLAFELFTGHLLESRAEHARLLGSAGGGAWLLHQAAPDLDPRVRPIIERLLAAPEERYGDASQVIEALAAALHQPFHAETIATRESFLQAAPLVGREPQMALLRAQLHAAERGTGSTILIGGESGAGKSRLIEAVRARGLVSGFVVVEGQAVSEGGSPYHLWRPVISMLAMRGEMGDLAAGVLRTIVPDLARLLGRDVPDPPVVDPAAAQSRLVLAVENLLSGQVQPLLILLEDLQWAGTESLALLAALTRVAPERPVAIIGTFRSDEASTLPSRVDGATRLDLPRLDDAAIAQLAHAMIGAAGSRPDIAAFLQRETEGIPLFIVEAVRSLAEGVGALAEIGSRPLPAQLLPGGIRRALQRRIDRVPDSAMAALRSAAVLGRELDPIVLTRMHPTLDLETWLQACADAAVIELHGQGGRFAHDKLREQVLESVSAEERVALHRRAAEAIERAYPNATERDTALAFHWGLAGDPARELHYQERSAVQALAGGAYQEAIVRFQRALALLAVAGVGQGAAAAHAPARRMPLILAEGMSLRRGMLETGLSEAHYRLGDLRACEVHAVQALAALGLDAPSGRLGLVRAIVAEGLERARQLLGMRRPGEASRAAIETVGRVHTQLIEVYFYSLRVLPVIWSTLRQLNVTEPFGPSPELSRAYIFLAVVCGVASLPRLAARWARHAVAIAEGAAAPGAVAYALNRSTAVELAHCWWDLAAAHIARADGIATAIGDMRLCEEARTQAGLVALYRGPLQPGLPPLQSAYELSRRSRSKQGACWSLSGQGDILVRLGRAADAVPLYEEALRRLDEQAMRTEAIWAWGGLALAWLRLDEPERALEHARRALGYLPTTAPVAFWIQHGTAATAEVLLTLMEPSQDDPQRRARARDAALAVAALRRYARRFPLGRAHARLWSGLLHWLSDRPRRAMRTWQAAIVAARALHCPYEEARAHLEIARHLPPGDAQWFVAMDSARALFEQTGCVEGLTLLQAERDRRGEHRDTLVA